MDSKSIYTRLCESGKARESQYGPKCGFHAHHIIPRHQGGSDDPSNLTYLTVKEHIFAHKLLWKIYGDPNDLRSMHMLGANLTPEQRKITGEFCRDNGIGFHGASSEQKSEWGKRGIEKQKESGSKNSWYWWSTPEGRKTRASMGGKAAHESGNGWTLANASQEYKSTIAKIGGKTLQSQNRKVMHKPGDKSFKRVLPEDVDQKLAEGYIFGSPRPSPRKGKSLAWVHHDEYEETKLVEKVELDNYLSEGWKRGRVNY